MTENNAETQQPDMGRRSWWITAGSLLGGLVVAWIFRVSTERRDVGRSRVLTVNLSEFPTQAGGVRTLAGGTVYVRAEARSDGSVHHVVRSLSCTHARCPLHIDGERIVCRCHGGVFDLSGKPVSGPPQRPLEVCDTETDGDVCYIRLPS
ncbi:MAG TPA: hypothetical protein DIS79_01760 [Bacteroidetes bacterium]|nr:hypothetical protein [Bacteroidota bacterium]HRK05628.1 Rieske (2Fe-2S) protein [Chlorobiota bacterium]